MANEKAKKMLERALKVIPKGANTMSKASFMWVDHDIFPIFAKSRNGCMLTSVDGREFIDLMGSLGPSFIAAEKTHKALVNQMCRGLAFSLPTSLETELAELICELYPGAEQVKFACNGSDVTTAAVRAARYLKGSKYILMASEGYHGWGAHYCAASQRSAGEIEDLTKYLHKFKYNDLEDLENRLQLKNYAAVIVEPVSLEEPHQGYLQGVRELCDKYDTLLIFDEIITSFRWSAGGAAEYFGVTPDMVCLGKCMGSGLPISALAGKKQLMEKAFDQIFFSATFFGSPLPLAAAIATLKHIKKHKDKIYPHVWKNGNKFKRKFNQWCREFGIKGKIKGMAPRMNVDFSEEEDEIGVRDLFFNELLKRGIFVGIQIYFTPQHKTEHVNKILQATKESLEEIGKALKEKDGLDKRLGGKRSFVIFKREG